MKNIYIKNLDNIYEVFRFRCISSHGLIIQNKNVFNQCHVKYFIFVCFHKYIFTKICAIELELFEYSKVLLLFYTMPHTYICVHTMYYT